MVTFPPSCDPIKIQFISTHRIYSIKVVHTIKIKNNNTIIIIYLKYRIINYYYYVIIIDNISTFFSFCSLL